MGLINMSCANGFSGKWCWVDNGDGWHFFLSIKKQSDSYEGDYRVSTYDKADSNLEKINFKSHYSSVVQTKVMMGWSNDIALVQLKLLNDKMMEWKLLKEPRNYVYVPSKAILIHCGE